MNKHELEQILDKEGFRPTAYSLAGGSPDEALCLSNEDGRWYVYYSERGLETNKKMFDAEGKACEYFLEQMRSDPTTKLDWDSGYKM